MDELKRKYSVTLRVHNSKREYRLDTEVVPSTDIETVKKILTDRFEILLHEVFK